MSPFPPFSKYPPAHVATQTISFRACKGFIPKFRGMSFTLAIVYATKVNSGCVEGGCGGTVE